MTARRVAKSAHDNLTIVMLIQKQENSENAKANGADVVILPAELIAKDLFAQLSVSSA